MRIGINALYLIPGGVGGTEIYLRGLVEALDKLPCAHTFVVFSNQETGPLGRHPSVLPVRAASRPARLLYEQFRLPGVLRRHGIDALLNPGFTAPARPPCPQVTVFHDLQHKRHPEYFRWFDLPFWELFLSISIRRSNRIIAVSEATRDDLMRYYRLPASKIDIVHHGVDPAFFELSRRREDGGYVLCPSTTHPHKNHARLMRAFARLRMRHPEARLVLTGVRGFAAAEVERQVKSLRLENAVEIRGWIPRGELYDAYRRARAFVYPSTFEGFGIPPLEALAAGLPAALSDIEPVRTLCGGAGRFFSPDDEDDLLAALEAVLYDEAERARLSAAGPERAAAYTWQRAAELTVASIEASLRA
ncbi:MAG: glycosyltransferase family 4 protein [Bryobacteraceae bacterium]|nr:glycosyltransferase family 4 protein [Bryobacteraceae bacterium]